MVSRLGARGGVAVALIFVIIAVVVFAKMSDHRTRIYPLQPSGTALPTVGVSAGDDAEIANAPTTFPDDVVIQRAASAFMASWLQSSLASTDWHANLAPLSTDSLTQSLDGVDPAGVPATRTIAPPLILRRGAAFAQVSVAVDTGTVVLVLVKQRTKWLVDDVDWDRT